MRYHSAGDHCPIDRVCDNRTNRPTESKRRRAEGFAGRGSARLLLAHVMTRRGTTHTPPWHRRLTLYLAASFALHGAVLVVRPPAVRIPTIPVVINRTVEFGLETARPATAPTPPAPAPTREPPVEPARPSPPTPRAEPRPPRVAARPIALPEPPATNLHEPTMLRDPDQVLVVRARDAGADALLASADAGSMEDVALASADAGSMEDVALAFNDAGAPDDAPIALALNDAGGAADAAPGALPTMAEAAGAMAAAVPEGSVVTLLLRTDRLREGPHAARVSALLDGIRDWQAVLGGTELDPIRDFDAVLLASANPVGTRGHPPDLMAIVRTHARRDFLRASVEQMAGVRANTPSGELPPDAGTLREHFARPDASALPRPTRSIWTRRNGVETTTVDRYLGPTSVALLQDDLAVFASPNRLPTLLSVLGGQTAIASALPRTDDAGHGPRLVALLTAQGLRNLMSVPSAGRGNPVPAAADLSLQATRDASGADDGGAILRSTWRYDSPEQAVSARRLVEVFILDVQDTINQFAGTWQGRLATSTGTVRLPVLRRALTRLSATTEGPTVRLDATLDRDEVSELLNLQRLSGLMQ